MSAWSRLYEDEINKTSSLDEYIYNKLKTKKKVVKLINKYATNHKVMEFGSGTGVLALKISTLNHYVTTLDSDKDMISLSKKYFLDKFKNPKIDYVCSDIRTFTTAQRFDVIYSIGILGSIVYIGYFIYAIRQKKLNLFYQFIFIFLGIISLFTGHVLISPMVSTYLALVYGLNDGKEITNEKLDQKSIKKN